MGVLATGPMSTATSGRPSPFVSPAPATLPMLPVAFGPSILKPPLPSEPRLIVAVSALPKTTYAEPLRAPPLRRPRAPQRPRAYVTVTFAQDSLLSFPEASCARTQKESLCFVPGAVQMT